MTTAQKRWTAAAVVMVWLYAAGAFVSLQPDPFEWSREGRFWFICIAPLVAAFAAAFPGWED